LNGREHTSKGGLLGAVGLLAAALGLVRLATLDDAALSPPGASSPVAGVAASAPTPATSVAAAVPTGALVQDPSWQRLSSTQRQTLAPLEQVLPTLSEAARRQWLAIASNFQAKPRAIQDRMHAKMTQWEAYKKTQPGHISQRRPPVERPK
jgi:Protein of unknown function (DUF3106)